MEKLLRLSGLPPGYLHCSAESLVAHQHWPEPIAKETPSSICELCHDPVEMSNIYLQTGQCDCLFCFPCARTMKNQFLENGGIQDYQCYRHHKKLPYSFFMMSGASMEDKIKFRKLVLSKNLLSVPHFKSCPTNDCFNGIVVPENSGKWLHCSFCERESYLTNFVQENLDLMPHPRDFVRPCPYCLKLYDKDSACNHVICTNPLCGEKINFLSGKSDPEGSHWDLYDRGPRTYRVKGDRNEKTGEIYQEYREGVKESDDLIPVD